MIKEIGRKSKEKTGRSELFFLDHMDDGTPMELTVKIDTEKVCDFFCDVLKNERLFLF